MVGSSSRSAEEEMPPEPDRLSALPEGLLDIVLSFLPAPQVVQTSVLSRRWRDLWRSTPYISINDDEYGISPWNSRQDLEDNWRKFEDFTTNRLLFHDNTSSLSKFRLQAHAGAYNHRDVDRWIRRGIKYCPQVLRIEILGAAPPLFQMPHLGPSPSCRLRRMRLIGVCLDKHFTELLCSGFPVMQDLKLILCSITLQDINSSTLKKLVIDRCFNYTGHPVAIRAPGLVSFHLGTTNGCYQNGIYLYETGSLVKASVHICRTSFPEKNECRLLGSLSSVTSLDLWGFETTAIFNENSDEFPMFPKLRALSLKKCFLLQSELKPKLKALGIFLQNALCLEKLTLQCCMFKPDMDYDSMDDESKSITLQCHDQNTYPCQKLKLIEVMYDVNQDHQIIELVWVLGKRLPDTSIIVTRI